MLEVIDPGILMTLQDQGRPGYAHIGIPPSGACDLWSLTATNLLAGARPDAAAAELTLGGTVVRAMERCTIALAGADLGAERDDGHRLRAGAVHLLPAGAVIRFGGAATGMRAYLGLAGGIEARRVLGSASTLLRGELGGIDGHGRPLGPGDLLVPVARGDVGASGVTWPEALAPHPARRSATDDPIRLVPGPDLRHLPEGTLERLCSTPWKAAAASDRMGIRLDGTPLEPGREILSHPVVPGTIQVPGDGRPLILLVDGPTAGGYPVVGVVPRAELPRLGQLRPGDPIRLVPQEPADARAAWTEMTAALDAAAQALHADAVWHRLLANTGG